MVPHCFPRSHPWLVACLLWASLAMFHAPAAPAPAAVAEDEAVSMLAREVQSKGWIAFSAHTGQGGWDLHLMRPDGSARRSLVSTPDANEFWPQFSRDGTRLLYRRLRRD